jgi:hypothetical protein
VKRCRSPAADPFSDDFRATAGFFFGAGFTAFFAAGDFLDADAFAAFLAVFAIKNPPGHPCPKNQHTDYSGYSRETETESKALD